MKTFRAVQSTTEYIDKTTCDACGKETHGFDSNWSEETYEVSKVKIKKEEGTIYPEGGTTDIEEFDICPDCWNDKLIPMMKQLGAYPNKLEKEY